MKKFKELQRHPRRGPPLVSFERQQNSYLYKVCSYILPSSAADKKIYLQPYLNS